MLLPCLSWLPCTFRLLALTFLQFPSSFCTCQVFSWWLIQGFFSWRCLPSILFAICISPPKRGRGISDVSPLSGISGLSVWSRFSISPLLFCCLVLSLFLSYPFGPFPWLSPPKPPDCPKGRPRGSCLLFVWAVGRWFFVLKNTECYRDVILILCVGRWVL